MDRWDIQKRKDEFMRGIDVEDQRRRLDNFAVNLRTQKRHEFQQKRRYHSLTVITTSDLFSDALLKAFPSLGDTSEPYELKLRLILQLLQTPQYQLDALIGLRKVLCRDTDVTVYGPLLDLGLVMILTGFLDWKFHSLVVREAAWCLANIAALTHDCVAAIIEAKGILALMSVTNITLGSINEVTLLALGNIVGDCVNYRDMVLNLGFTEMLCDFASQAASIDLGVLRTVSWCMSNVAKGHPQIDLNYVRMLTIQAKFLLDSVRDKRVKSDVMWCLANISEHGSAAIQEIIDRGLVKHVLTTLRKSKSKIRLSGAVRVLGNLSTGSELQTQHLLNDGMLDDLRIFLNKGHYWSLVEVMWSLSNVAAGSRGQIGALLSHPIMCSVHETFNSTDIRTRKETSYIYSNIARLGSMKQVLKLVHQGVINKLPLALSTTCAVTVCVRPKQNTLVLINSLLEAGADEVKPIHRTRNFVRELLEESGVVKQLEGLQHHNNRRVYELASEILIRHYDAETVQPEEFAAEVPSVFAFS
jgi:hypothetical protein